MNTKPYHLIGPDGKEYQTTERGTVYGCKSIKIYGRRDCPVPKRYIKQGTYETPS